MHNGAKVFYECLPFEWVPQSVDVVVSIGAGFILEVRLIRDLLVRVVGAVRFDRIFGRVEPEVVPPGRLSLDLFISKIGLCQNGCARASSWVHLFG